LSVERSLANLQEQASKEVKPRARLASLAREGRWPAVLSLIRRRGAVCDDEWEDEDGGKTAVDWARGHGADNVAREVTFFSVSRHFLP
jgi:hypothetical protein